MTRNEIKQLIIARKKIQAERDALGGGLDAESLGKNPMALLGQIGNLQKVVELSKEIERLSDLLAAEMIRQIQEVTA